MDRNDVEKILSENSIKCAICNKEVSLVINRKDQSISFKSHLNQSHNISINDYFELKSTKLCKFCKTEPVAIKVKKDTEGKVTIEDTDLCDSKSCISERKKLNTNSV